MTNHELRIAAENALCGGGNSPEWAKIQEVCRQWLAECDADLTESAKPSYWRGQDDGVAAICGMVHAILDACYSGIGAASEPWESLRRRLLSVRRDIAKIRDDLESLARPVDGQWLKSIGAVRPMAVAAETVYVLGEWRPENCGCFPITFSDRMEGIKIAGLIMSVFGVQIRMNVTRGDVLYLCKSLNITLK